MRRTSSPRSPALCRPASSTTATGTLGANALTYTGREDDGTGLKYYRARYYHPGLARFISEDPIGFSAGSVNLYSYVLNNPLLLIDPLGLYTVEQLAAVIYNESAGLRGDLREARIAMANVILNREAIGVRERYGPRGTLAAMVVTESEMSSIRAGNAVAGAAYAESLTVAALVLAGRK